MFEKCFFLYLMDIIKTLRLGRDDYGISMLMLTDKKTLYDDNLDIPKIHFSEVKYQY